MMESLVFISIEYYNALNSIYKSLSHVITYTIHFIHVDILNIQAQSAPISR